MIWKTIETTFTYNSLNQLTSEINNWKTTSLNENIINNFIFSYDVLKYYLKRTWKL